MREVQQQCDVLAPPCFATDGGELPIRGDAAKPVLPPYATPPSRLYRPGQKSAAAECDSFQELWDWLAGSDKDSKYPYRC